MDSLYKGRLGGVEICRLDSRNWYEIINYQLILKSIFQDMTSTIPRPDPSDRHNDAHAP